MNKQNASIDLVRLALYILKRVWLVILCAAIGFGLMYWRSSKRPDTYTAYGTMFVTNSNPNLVNYGYANSSDISSAVQLVNIYSEVVKSESVMQIVLEAQTPMVLEDGTEKDVLLSQKYPGLTTNYIRATISMVSVNETPMVRVSCTTNDPQKSADICTAVLNVAPEKIKDVVGAGEAKPQDYPQTPRSPNARSDRRRGMTGAMEGAALAAALLTALFLLNQRVEEPKELADNYTLPILSTVKRRKGESEKSSDFLLTNKSEMDLVESYAKLRMNLLYTLVGKDRHSVLVTSAISGEGKSTIAANLAVSMATAGKRVLLVDADMRRACQGDVFRYSGKSAGLSDILVGSISLPEAIMRSVRENLDILPAGSAPPNPSELLDSPEMHELLSAVEKEYDLVLMDAPPINIVSDPLALSTQVAGGLFVVRQNFSDHREIRRALQAAEMTGLDLLGFVFYGERLHQGSYYSRKYYHGYHYYHKYDTRSHANTKSRSTTGRRSASREASGTKTVHAEKPRESVNKPEPSEGKRIDDAQQIKETARRANDNEQAQETGAGTAPSAADGNYRRRRRSGRE